MTTGILINARLASKRLNHKHLLEIKGVPILTYLLNRIRYEFQDELLSHKVRIIIVTHHGGGNEQFENFGKNIDVYYGSETNIPLRHCQAAHHFHLDNIINVDGDDILCSFEGMRIIYERLNGNNYSKTDCIPRLIREELNAKHEYVKTINLPFGMNSFGYSTAFLTNTVESHLDEKLETGWLRIFDNSKLTVIEFPFDNVYKMLRFSLDYPGDFEFFNKLISTIEGDITQLSDIKIIDHVIKNGLFVLTIPLQTKYLDHFHTLHCGHT